MMVSREELLQSIRPDMRLDKNFFMRIYGYELTWPGFARTALDKLEAAGCSRAGEYYMRFVSEYEAKQEVSLKEAAHWYISELEKKWKQREGEEQRKQQKIEQIVNVLETMSDGDLLKLWQKQKQQNPEVF